MAENMETISVQDYIANVLPGQLTAQGGLGDGEFAVQYNIDGILYATKFGVGSTEVVPDSVENPLVLITMDEAAWRAMINEEVPATNALVSPDKMSLSRLEKIQATKGKFNLELTTDDGSVVSSTSVFNSTETPEVTLMMKAEDYAKILKGELNSQMAFMTGKLKFKGDMNFLMKLGGLM